MIRIIGVDIGGTKCALILAEIDSNIRFTDRKEFPTFDGTDTLGAIKRIIDGIRELLLRHNLTPRQITAVGISCGGPLDSNAGIILGPPNLPGWNHVAITKIIEDEFGIPAYLQNDANACALAEWKLGAGRNMQHMIFLTMGTGLGAGVIVNGHLLNGACGMGGEIGHIRIEADGPEGYGKTGSLEGFASGGGIALLAKEKARKALDSGKPVAFAVNDAQIDDLTTKKLAEYARQGDVSARAVFAEAGEKLGKGLAILVDILNPECIVLGGVFGRCEEFLRPTMEEALIQEALHISRCACRIVAAQTGEQIGDYGSIMAALYAMSIDPNVLCLQPKARHMDALIQNHPVLDVCRSDIIQAFDILKRCYQQEGKLLACGNGGSSSDCDHIVGELMKGFLLSRPLPQLARDKRVPAEVHKRLQETLQQALPAISLASHQALNTAFANDADADLCFAQQVIGYGRAGDVLLAISTSGNSENVLLAAQAARLSGLYVVGLTGRSGGKLKAMTDVCICVPSDTTTRIQELHLPVYHTLCAMLEDVFFAV